MKYHVEVLIAEDKIRQRVRDWDGRLRKITEKREMSFSSGCLGG